MWPLRVLRYDSRVITCAAGAFPFPVKRHPFCMKPGALHFTSGTPTGLNPISSTLRSCARELRWPEDLIKCFRAIKVQEDMFEVK